MPYMGHLKQSTAVNKTILMIDSSDHITGKTGLAAGITKYLTKAAGTPAATTITTTELDSTNVKGIYKLAFADSDVDTLGDFQLHLTATGADPADYWWRVSTYLPGEAATLQADQAVNTTKFGGTTVTARDIGASVLLSSGSGTGQLDFTSGVVKANLAQILGTALTETAGQIAAAFKKFFDKATPTGTINSLPDAVPGAAGGLLVDDVWTDARAAKLDNLDATVSSRLATSGYTAPDNADIALIKAQTDKLTFDSDNFVESHPMTGVIVTTNNDKIGYTASTVTDKTGYALTSAYDPAKTASQDSDMAVVLANVTPLTFDSNDYVLSHPMTAISATVDSDDRTLIANESASALLKYDWTTITGEASRSVLNALRFIRNKFSTVANNGFVTVYKEDDTTQAYTKALTTDSDANPIVVG